MASHSRPPRSSRRWRRRPPRATVIVVCDGHVALIRRKRRSGRERERYWVLPGGGIERNESPAQAARREVAEELGLDVQISGPLGVFVDPDGRHHHLFCAHLTGPRPTLRLGGPELAHCSPNNFYEPRWVPLDRLPKSLRGPVPRRLVRLVAREDVAAAA